MVSTTWVSVPGATGMSSEAIGDMLMGHLMASRSELNVGQTIPRNRKYSNTTLDIQTDEVRTTVGAGHSGASQARN